MDSLPEELQFRNITSKKKTILEKQQRQVLPSNGTEQTATYSSGPQIVFRVPIDNEWSIQMDSAWITGNVQCKNVSSRLLCNNAADALGTPSTSRNLNLLKSRFNINDALSLPILAQCESWESMIYRVAVYLNGSELERIDNYSYLESFKHHYCNNANWCNLQSGIMGISESCLDKSRNLLIGAESYGSAPVGAAPNTTFPDTGISAKLQIAFPLRFLGLMNIKSLLPAYLLGPNSLEVRIWMAPAGELFTQGVLTNNPPNSSVYDWNEWSPITSNALSYTFSDIRMNLNYIQTEPSYNNALSQYLISNNLQIPIDTYFITQFPIPRDSKGWITQNISVQYSNINSIYCIFTRNSEASSAAYLGTDRLHFPEGLSQAKLTVNGKVMPSVPILFGNPGFANHPTVAINARDGYLSSAVCGVSNNFAPEAFTYLMKALGYNTSAEVIGNVGFLKEQTQISTYHRTLPIALAANPTNAQINTAVNDSFNAIRDTITVSATTSGNGMFYASNKAVYQNPFVANAVNSEGRCNPLECEELYWKTPTYFALGWSMTRSDYSDEFELSGYNASSNSGIVQVGLQFGGTVAVAESSITAANAATTPQAGTQLAPFDNYTCWVFIEHTRVLDIGKDNAQVLY